MTSNDAIVKKPYELSRNCSDTSDTPNVASMFAEKVVNKYTPIYLDVLGPSVILII